jgi:hypothetical protein
MNVLSLIFLSKYLTNVDESFNYLRTFYNGPLGSLKDI